MGTGIIVCSLNGAGKSTLGQALAKKIGFHFIDNEELYFPKIDPDYLYASPRTREEVVDILLSEIGVHADFVFASVKRGLWRGGLFSFSVCLLIDVPCEIRIQRVKNRSFEKFGSRMLPGGVREADGWGDEKGPGTAYRPRPFFSAVIDRCVIDKREYVFSD